MNSRYIKPAVVLFACIICFAGFSFKSYSQRKMHFMNRPHYDYRPYHFGFLLGINKMDFALQPVENFNEFDMNAGEHNFEELHTVLTKPEYGFNIGIVSNLKLGQLFDLRFIPTLTFGDRNITYEGIDEDDNTLRRNQPIESTLLDFPLHVKFKSVRMNNTRVYILGGAKYSYDLASLEDMDESDPLATISKNDYFYELGVGFDYYFYYFKLTTEIKASFGIRDILKDDNTIYTNAINQLNSNFIQISLMFE